MTPVPRLREFKLAERDDGVLEVTRTDPSEGGCLNGCFGVVWTGITSLIFAGAAGLIPGVRDGRHGEIVGPWQNPMWPLHSLMILPGVYLVLSAWFTYAARESWRVAENSLEVHTVFLGFRRVRRWTNAMLVIGVRHYSLSVSTSLMQAQELIGWSNSSKQLADSKELAQLLSDRTGWPLQSAAAAWGISPPT